MTPAPSSARRLSLLGCLLAAAAAAALPGCGDEGAATAKSTATAQPERQAKASGEPCPRPVDALLDSLDALRSRLALGLSYEQYAAKVKGLRAGYDEIPVGRLTIECLATAGTPSEQALNEYIDGANAWGECLADASCTTAAIEPVLQRKWRLASRLLSEAR